MPAGYITFDVTGALSMVQRRIVADPAAASQRVTVVGCGHVGLVLAAGLARLGHQVQGLDRDPSVVLALSRGVPSFYEEGLEELMAEGVASGRLSFTTSYDVAVPRASFVFLAVDTPPGQSGAPDLTNLRAAAGSIGRALRGSHPIVVVKSTVPVGTGALIEDILHSSNGRTPLQTRVVANPEFLRQGRAVHDFFHPDRTVIGAADATDAQAVARLFTDLPGYVLTTDVATAEMTKYASNAFLATRLSLINEIAAICDAVGVDIDGVVEGMGYDPRIGHAFSRPGIGYGGSCLPKDVAAARHLGALNGVNTPLLSAVQAVNASQPGRAVDRLRASLGELDGLTIAVWGVTFKAGTDDVRQSPAIDVINLLMRAGARLRIYDPSGAVGLPDHLRGALRAEPLEAARDADALAVLCDWPEFANLDLALLHGTMRGDVILDGRNALDPQAASAAGFQYVGMGRGSASPSAIRMIAARSGETGVPSGAQWPISHADDVASEPESVPLPWEAVRSN